MKTIKALILSFLSIFIGFTTQAQRAKHGNYTVSTMNDVVNTYTNLTASASAGSMSITVASNAMTGAHFSGVLEEGDLIMIYQAYGADINIDTGTDDNGFGDYTVSWGHVWTVPHDWSLFAYEWGELWGYGNAGKYEQVEVAGVNGTTIINLQCGLKNSYDFDKRVQIVRIPRYDNLTVNNASSIEPAPWNGTVGGIVAIEVETALTVNAGGLISATGFGFRGGQLDASGQTGNPASPYELRYLGSKNASFGSEKGESIFGYHAELDLKLSRYGIGAPANGGGGGGFQNAGGGGGSNVSNSMVAYTGYGVPDPAYNAIWALDFSAAPFTLPTNQAGAFGTNPINGANTPGGGRGGYALSQTNQDETSMGPMNSSWGGDARKINGGRGGHPLTYDATRMFFGGGGGAGDQDNGQGGAGGNGGGIVYISSFGTISGAGTIAANGNAGQNSNPNNLNVAASPTASQRRGNDGAGGGGAGGSIFIENATAIPASINLTAIGGNGGNQNIRLYHNPPILSVSDEAGGPGGSGAGGSIAFSSGAPSQNVSAGANGVVNSERGTSGSGYNPTPNPMMEFFPPNGATNGSVGMSGLAAPYYDLTIRDTTICSGSVDLTVTVLGSTSGTIGWYTQEFGGSTFDTGITTTVSPAVTTTYYVGVCPGTFRIPVTVTVNSADDASFTSGDFCVTSVNTISGVATPSGTFSISAQTGSATINPTTGVLAGFSVGDQITIQYTTPAGPCQNSSTQVVNVTAADDASFTTGDFCASTVNTISGVVTASGTFSIASQTGSMSATINPTTGVLSGFSAGDQITIRYTTPAGPCQNSTTQVVNVNAADDATFVSGDFCASAVNTISGVVTPSGTFSISAQTGSATINPSTGILSGFSAGDQITIQYTTPAGACQSSSTQVVNVNAADDASFTSGDFCASGVNTISGVVTPSGTFSISAQTGSMSATINPSTGILSGFSAGDQITIQYTTPAGACQNSSTQVVNVNAVDDASFTSGDFCVSGVNTISGVATPSGTFSIASQTGSGSATINPTSGILSGFSAGDQITIQYTTPAGACQNSSTQVVNVNALDDASFTSGDFCVSGVNTISGVATPSGTFSISAQTGAATINPSTGVLSGFAAGDQITIQYTTPGGGCQNSSTQVVNVNALDDASFTSGDFCESTVNTISGVVTASGTFSISAQTGSMSATINPSTGILSGFSAGDQITIQYTTPAGGCQNSSTQVVNVDPLDDASFTSGDFCVSSVNSISAVATPSGTFSISAQTGSATINPTTGILAGFAAGDQITIQYTTPAAGGCQNSSTQVVNVFDLPVINVSNNGPICSGGSFNLNETGGDAVSWNWSTSSGAVITTNTDQSPSVSGASDGDVFNLTITDANTCTNTGSTSISVIPVPVLDPITNVTNCGPYILPTIQGTNLTAGAAYYDDSQINGGQVITGPISSSQTVWVYDGSASCNDELSFDVTIDPLPTVVSITGGNNYCVGDVVADVIVEVTGTSDWTLDYTLDGAPQNITSTTSTISLGNAPGVYVMTNLADANCTSSVSGTQTIVVTNPPAQPVASGDVTYCTDEPMSDMTVSGAGGTYTWYTDNTLTTVYGTGSSIAPSTQTMTYYVTESLNGCESTADDVMITIENCEVIYPTAFTPDGDGTNDTWEILGLDEAYPDNIVRVYNRWGNLIFEHKSSVTNPYDNNRWDGTYKGSPLPVGSFYYIIDLDGSSNQETGTVSIILN